MKFKQRLLLVVLIGFGAILALAAVRSSASTGAEIRALVELPETSSDGFQPADGSVEIQFPADHGPHEEYQTEWWYYTGNLSDPQGRRFGYQLTFFRRALSPDPVEPSEPPTSAWRTSQAFSVHFTITDVSNDDFIFEESFSRGAAGLAGAQAEPYRVWLHQYQVAEQMDGSYLLDAKNAQAEIRLALVDVKGPVLHGDEGLSQKGPYPGDASYYLSQTRLESKGTITIGGASYSVEGLSWMDHEFSTSALSPGQVGWDWFSIQLENLNEIMLFQLRREDGTIDPYSSGTLVKPDGSTRTLRLKDFRVRVIDTWKSPQREATYPAGWEIEIPSEDLVLRLEPLIPDQELLVSVTYWEGAVSIEGSWNGNAVEGNGYVELTGYDGSIAGRV